MSGRGGARPGAGRKPGNAWDRKKEQAIASRIDPAMKVREVREACSVYVIGETDQPSAVKFGLARDVARRLVHLQIGNPRLMKVYAVIEVKDNEAAFALEEALHERFQSAHVRGEWFKVDIEQAVAALNEEAVRLFDLRLKSIRQSENSNGTWREEGGGGSQADLTQYPLKGSG